MPKGWIAMNEISLGSANSNAITGHTTPADAIAGIQSGKWANEIAALRSATGTHRDRLKKLLPAFLWAGKFTARKNDGIENFSGLICADVDKVAERVGELHDIARNDPHAAAAFVSPSGTGIKIVFRVPVAADAKDHQRNFAAVRAHVASHYRAQVDEAAKDCARLCFVSHDPTAFFNAEAAPLEVNAHEVAPKLPAVLPAANIAPSSRTQIAGRILGPINWTDKGGFCKCPGEHLHTTANGAKDCMVMLDSVPTIKCLHNSCAGIVDGVNHELRSRIGKAERPAATNSNRAGIAAEYLGEESEPQDSLPELIDAAAFIACLIEPPAELVEGILHLVSKLVFGGSSKSFKTWCLLDLAISIATGTNWLGRRTAQGKVLFVNFEIQPHAWQRRISAVAEAKAVQIQPGAITLWNLRGHAADFRQLIPKIIERCRAEKFALIILDPIYKLYGGTDENAAGDVAELLNSLESLAVETGAAIAFGAHFAKGNASAKEAIDRISGSGVFARDPDSLLIFTKHETDDAFTVEPILRNFAPVAPFVVRWEFPLMRPDDELDPAKLKQAAGRKPTYLPDDLLKLLPRAGLMNPEWMEKAAEEGISRPTFYRLKKALFDARKIHQAAVTGVLQPILTK
jgi:hypothetical protein